MIHSTGDTWEVVYATRKDWMGGVRAIVVAPTKERAVEIIEEARPGCQIIEVRAFNRFIYWDAEPLVQIRAA